MGTTGTPGGRDVADAHGHRDGPAAHPAGDPGGDRVESELARARLAAGGVDGGLPGRPDEAAPAPGWRYGDCGFEEVTQGWEFEGMGALPTLPGERCER